MKLQVALDRLSEEQCIETISATHEHVDIIEIGTGVLHEYGLSIVKNIKKNYPDKLILADLKICDAGDSESRNAFEYGADIITVMSFADLNTIHSCLKNAEKYHGEVVVDMLNNQSAEILNGLSSINATSISLHVGKDQQNHDTLLSPLSNNMESFNFNVYVAGGINEDNIEQFLKLNPDVVIVGSGITKSIDMTGVSERLKRKITLY